MSSTLPSVLGGGKYKPYIDQLVQIAENKRKPLELRLERSNLEKDILSENRRDIPVIQSALRQLYGLDSVFRQNLAISSDPSVLTAEAQRGAKPVEMHVQVHQTAAADRFYSKELSKDFQVPSGDYKFFVGEHQVNLNFDGGSLDDFANQLSTVSPEYLKATVVRSSADKQTLLIDSQKTGAENRLYFQNKARDFAFEIGLITDQINMDYVVTSDTAGLKPGTTLDPSRELQLNPGRYLDIALQATAPLKLKEGAYLSFSYTKNEETVGTVSYPPEPTAMSKTQALKEGFLVPMQDEEPLNLPRPVDETDVYLIINGKLMPIASLPVQSDYQEMKLDLSEYEGEVQGIVLRNQGLTQSTNVKNLKFSTPLDIDFAPVNPASIARDAEFTLDGVLVKRPTNNIDDVTPEVKINLLGSSPQPVTLSVRPDFDRGEEAIKNFILSYNYYMSKLNIITANKENSAIIEELSFETEKDRENSEKKLGIYQGDSQFVQLKNSLFNLMIQSYTVGEERNKKMVFNDMGISTSNNLGVFGDASTRRGYFQIDDKKLRAKLESSWGDVRDFFASRTGETLIADDGLAVKMNNYLTPFSGRDGLVSKRIDLVDTRIKSEEKQIDDFNEKLKDQKKKWEMDFAKAEAAEAEMERLKKQMDGFFSNGK